MATKRIQKEVRSISLKGRSIEVWLTTQMKDLAKEDLGEISLTPNEANIFVWKAVFPGPEGSPYEGGMFEVDIRIPEDYPYVPLLIA